MGTIIILPPLSSVPFHWQRPYETKPKLTVRIVCDQRKEDLELLAQENNNNDSTALTDNGETGPAASMKASGELLIDLSDGETATSTSSTNNNNGIMRTSGEVETQPIPKSGLKDSRRPLSKTGLDHHFHTSATDNSHGGNITRVSPGGLFSFLSPSMGARKRKPRKPRVFPEDNDYDSSTDASESDTELVPTNGEGSSASGAAGYPTFSTGSKRKKKQKLPFPGIPLHVKREDGGMVITGDGIMKKDDQGDLVKSLSLSTRAARNHRQRVGSQSSPIKKSGWSYPFAIDVIGDDFELKFYDEDVDLDNYTLCLDVSVRGRGATKMVTFIRATDDHIPTKLSSPRDTVLMTPRLSTNLAASRNPTSANENSAATGRQNQKVKIKFRIPLVDIKFTSELNENDEILRTTITEINADMYMGPTKEYFYFFIQNLQMDNMFANAEYPVLLAMDRRKLYGYDANLLELLVETSIREGFKSVDYMGLRVLPIVFKLDGELLKTITDLKDYFNFNFDDKARDEDDDIDEEDDEKARKKTYALYSSIKTEADVPALNITEEVLKKVYVEKLQIFPLEFTFCVGDNELSWPVIQDETPVELVPFEKGEMYETAGELTRVVTKYYTRLAKDEVYRIILSLDAIGGPLSAFSKLSKGCQDAVILPWSSLVLDDTPGAFFVGLAGGAWSLFFNLSDAGLTIMLRLIGWASWISLSLTFDPDYKLVKRKVRRNHPPNVWNGLAQGIKEFGRGVWAGVSGLVTEGYKGARAEGCVGFVKGLWRGAVGLPVKPIGGLFDFLGKTLEGLLHSMGTGYTTQNRIHEPMERIRLLTFNQESGIQYWLEKINEIYGGHCYVKIRTRRGRLRDRLLVLTSASFHIINIEGLTEEEDYQPKTVPLSIISEILVPLFPETSFTVCTSKVLHGRDKFHFVVPDRESIIHLLKELIADNQGKRIKVRGIHDERNQS